jgi:hypothetical protein
MAPGAGERYGWIVFVWIRPLLTDYSSQSCTHAGTRPLIRAVQSNPVLLGTYRSDSIKLDMKDAKLSRPVTSPCHVLYRRVIDAMIPWGCGQRAVRSGGRGAADLIYTCYLRAAFCFLPAHHVGWDFGGYMRSPEVESGAEMDANKMDLLALSDVWTQQRRFQSHRWARLITNRSLTTWSSRMRFHRFAIPRTCTWDGITDILLYFFSIKSIY